MADVVRQGQFRTFAGGSQYAAFCCSCGLLQDSASAKNVKDAFDELGRDLYSPSISTRSLASQKVE
jgi:hypothetical protein